jgi:hypothetical protein
MVKGSKLKIKKIRGAGFLSFSKEIFKTYIPIPRNIRVIGGDLFPKLSNGLILILKKK